MAELKSLCRPVAIVLAVFALGTLAAWMLARVAALSDERMEEWDE